MSESVGGSFVPGLELNTRFYWQVVRPVILRVVPVGRFADAILLQIADPTLRAAAAALGAVDQFADCDAIDSRAAAAARLRAAYLP